MGLYPIGKNILRFICLSCLGFSITSLILMGAISRFGLRLNLFVFEGLEILIALVITIGISLVSYHCFEKVFLKLKNHFSTIQSRPCLLYTSPSPRDRQKSRMPSSA